MPTGAVPTARPGAARLPKPRRTQPSHFLAKPPVSCDKIVARQTVAECDGALQPVALWEDGGVKTSLSL
eukprot:5551016-Prymnesium_polylepis.1